MCPNKRLSKQSWSWWFQTPSRPLLRHWNVFAEVWNKNIVFWTVFASPFMASHAFYFIWKYYNDAIMGAMASQNTGVSSVHSNTCSGVDKKKTPKLCVTGLCEGNSPVNAPYKGPVTRKMFPFYDVIAGRLISFYICFSFPMLTALSDADKTEILNRHNVLRNQAKPTGASDMMKMVRPTIH